MYALSRYPEKQAILASEVDRVVKDSENITSTQIGHMPYLRAVLKETLRLVTHFVNFIEMVKIRNTGNSVKSCILPSIVFGYQTFFKQWNKNLCFYPSVMKTAWIMAHLK